ncbi:MAG: hypothetical protein A2287_02365 [Candidatus Melainabacteria bacterium RIFOXYA12_FULL_32_12]|nr:MAG: hypothetical protein A2255_04355 [Candidatus Melainabacteria bacterium RIFOXYA2_FULL_32_9]OGI30929.1 MAG: hypothetical protein A2287_02365 [Candidatus Melainabacteria bacterium RIFOXYA12_FULL_32_12]
MTLIKDKIDKVLKEKSLTYYQLSKLADFDESALNKMIRGKISFSANLIEKMAPILQVSKEEIQGWILADKYPKETIELAIKAKKELLFQDNTHCHSERSEESQRSFANAQDYTPCHCEPPQEAWQSNNSSNKSNDIESKKRSFVDAQDDEGLILTTKIDSLLQEKGISRTALSKQINYSQGKLNEMIIGKEPISPLVISKIAPILDVSENQIKSWILADKYSLTTLENAFNSFN